VSSELSGEALAKSEALAKEDWSFGGLRRTAGATGSCPWGSTEAESDFRLFPRRYEENQGGKTCPIFSVPR